MDRKTAEAELAKDIGSFALDPLKFVIYAFPWGVKGTELEHEHGPRKWQRELLVEIGEKLRAGHELKKLMPLLIARASGHGVGKALDNNELVATPHGWRAIGDLKTDEEVFAADGSSTRVVGVYPQGRQAIYRVWFDDGSYSDATLDHLWAVRGRRERRRSLDGWRVLSTRDLIEAGVKRSNGAAEARQWEIPQQGAVRYPYSSLRWEPYLLAMWIANGSKGKGILSQPREPEWDDFVWRHGIKRTPYKSGADCDCWTVPKLVPALRKLGLLACGSHERFVPAPYKTATIEDRRALLAGLMDTDGTIDARGVAVYDTTSPYLARDVMELVRSLGGKAQLQPVVKDPFYRNADGEKVQGRPCYRVTVRLPFNPFRVARKAQRWRPCEPRYLARWVDRIEYLHDAEATCIRVEDGFHCFLTRDYIVTHNSALVAWIILWALSTMPGCRVVVTANTEIQLRTKTWPEVTKWVRRSINRHWWDIQATSLATRQPALERTWRADAIPWSETNTEAFAGLHNEGNRIILVFDESSAIDDTIWEVAEGALTDANTEIVWLVFGNPTRNTGRFRECFPGGKFQHRWSSRQIDSRGVDGTNKELFAQWVEDYGEDSDFVRVRVRGVFPRAGSMQFISAEVVDEAMKADRDVQSGIDDPFIMGVDVARFGMDATVIAFRRGRECRGVPWVKLRGADTMTVAAKVVELFEVHRPDVIFVDGGGPGGGVVDRLQMLKYPVVEVQFGAKSDRALPSRSGAVAYANKRAEMWGAMRDWLPGAALPNDRELAAGLCAVEYGYTIRDGKDCIILERKDAMRARGLASPDEADALCLTFSYPVMPSDHRMQLRGKPAHQVEYDPYAEAFAAGRVSAGRR